MTAPSPVIAYLTTGFYLDMGLTPRSWAFTDLTVNLTRMDATSRQLAEEALDTWAEVTAFTFTETDGPAHLTFWSGRPLSATYFALDGDVILSADIHLSHWLPSMPVANRLQTIIHEIGHGLGLGHPGPYNGFADPDLVIFPDDTREKTVMSYGDGVVVTGPQEYDVAALWDMYGRPHDINGGDTVHTVKGGLHSHIIDDSGYDVIRLIGDGVIDMRPGSETETLSLGEDTVIEAVYFDDGATVEIMGSAGNDVIGVWG